MKMLTLAHESVPPVITYLQSEVINEQIIRPLCGLITCFALSCNYSLLNLIILI